MHCDTIEGTTGRTYFQRQLSSLLSTHYCGFIARSEANYRSHDVELYHNGDLYLHTMRWTLHYLLKRLLYSHASMFSIEPNSPAWHRVYARTTS